MPVATLVKSVCEKYKEQCHENDLGYNHGSVSFGFPDNCITVASYWLLGYF
jgi:hypothetical protein